MQNQYLAKDTTQMCTIFTHTGTYFQKPIHIFTQLRV